MRSGIKFLAASGILGIALGFVNAQDRDSSYRPDTVTDERPRPSLKYFARDDETAGAQTARPRTATPGVEVPTRYRRTPAAGAPRTDAAAPASRGTSAAPATGRRNYYRELFGEDAAVRPEAPAQSATRIDSQIAPAGYGTQAAGQPGSADKTPHPFDEAAAEKQGVIHAEYEQREAGRAQGTIQQVRGTEEAFPQLRIPAGQQDNPFEVEAEEFDAGPAVDTQRVDALRREYEALRSSRGLSAPSQSDARPAQPQRQAEQAPVLFSDASSAAEDVPFVHAVESGAQNPAVSVHWEKQGDISVGQESGCVLVVRNTGKSVVHGVVVDSYFPATIRLTRAIPTPQEAPDHLTWTFESLAVGEEQRIQVQFIPSQRGDVTLETNVRFAAAVRGSFTVAEPLLQIAVKGPGEVLVGEAAPQFVTVTNPGTGIARNVRLEARIPKGLEHARGERLLMEIGDLNPGETQDVKLSLVAVGGGKHAVEVQATADPDLSQATTAEIVVEAPSLMLQADGPGLRYLGRSAQYEITVTNDGTTAANNVRVLHRLPGGFEFLNASHGGKFEKSTGTIGWFVGQLAAGESTQVMLELDPKQLGSFDHEIRVTSEQGAIAETVVQTKVDGTASLILEIVDRDDPVEVGAETLYEIRVRNNGTKAAENVGLSCELPAGVTLLSAKGPADHISENNVLIFKNLPELAPGKAAVYHVHIKGTQSGNHRVRAHLTSDAIEEPLLFEELTKFYQD